MNKKISYSSPSWESISALLFASMLISACSNTNKQTATDSGFYNTYVCDNAARYKGKTVGDGHCVSLIKTCSEAPNTNHWKQGKKVLNQTKLAPGTVIATFKNGRYPNKTGWHAAIYISHDSDGIWVWDQWKGKPVHKRLIRIRNNRAAAGNTAQKYSVVTR